MKPVPPAVSDDPGEPLFDYALIVQYVRFVFGALRRHKWVAAFAFLVVISAGVAALKTLPKTWHAETRLLAQRHPVLPALGNPTRAVPADADAPTRAAVDTILRRDSLVSLIKQTNLLAEWDARRAPLLRALDATLAAIGKVPTTEERLDDFIELLEKKLRVSTDEGTVTISVDWPDAEMAYRIVETAQQDFLETRHVAELSAITEAIGILEEHANRAEEGIAALIADLRKAREQQGAMSDGATQDGRGRARTFDGPARTHRALRSRPEAAEIAQLQLSLASKRRAIEDLEEFRRRRIDELQQRLTELRVSYAPAHPLVRGTEDSLAALSSSDSPQLAMLKREEREVRARLAQLTAEAPTSSSQTDVEQRPATLSAMRTGPGLGLALRLNEERDPSLEYGDSQLRMAVDKYQALVQRLEAARIELDTTHAAFKYRYVVLKPARIPRKPVKLRSMHVLFVSLVAGVLLALGAAVARELKRPQVLERWQVERWLGLKVLAESSGLHVSGEVALDYCALWISARSAADWRWLTVVPLHSTAGSSEVGCALRAMGELHTGEHVELVDARNLGEEQLAPMVAHINAKATAGVTAIVLVGPPLLSKPATSLALSSEAIVVTLCYGITLGEAQETLRRLGPTPIIGCVIVPPGGDQLLRVRRGPGVPAHQEHPGLFGDFEQRETPCV